MPKYAAMKWSTRSFLQEKGCNLLKVDNAHRDIWNSSCASSYNIVVIVNVRVQDCIPFCDVERICTCNGAEEEDQKRFWNKALKCVQRLQRFN